ncbi:hypothetical protein DYB25_000240 [Aphanomyces astaci]|uniref:CCT domain-containing protein n=1 Tax=Aphanomyces astaci TaxID=112090 RepID=A0A397AWG6_APHAT|nr:hypothetical protein DYB36_001940 [Aphanomyces astaci]RHY12130.1 hypothetical protein DYB25_000240 [Aphanomyces astaci]RHY41226.1 hypothetical protein DYB30_003161 [Aphanomyces astaci]RHY74894.1 hypothetical protein DYB38_001779 [Aphanomyces astaci]RHZ16474.1 hypothetical protein DYB31_000316 [Aphanomyces astaci]
MLLLHAVDAVDDIDVAESLMALTKGGMVRDYDLCDLVDVCVPSGPSGSTSSTLRHLTELAQQEFKFMNSPTGVDDAWSLVSVTKMEQGLKRMKVEDLSLDGHYLRPSTSCTEDDDDDDLHYHDTYRQRKLSVSSWSSSDSDSYHLHGDATKRRIGSYSPEDRAERIQRYLEKRKHRTWGRKINYGVRKNFADSRLRVKGRFVKKEDEELLCLYLGMT